MLRNNFKLFNDRLYVILTIKQEEKAEILEIVKKYNLKIMYPKVFEETSNLSQFTIDDKKFGGHLAGFICWYEFSIIKNTNKGIFKDVEALKEYLKLVGQRKEHFILQDNNRNKYYSYVDSLSDKDLIDEYCVVKSVISFLDNQYKLAKEFITTLSRSISNDIKNSPTKETVNGYLSQIRNYINTLDTAVNIDLFLINKDNCSREVDDNMPSLHTNVGQMRMRSFLKQKHEQIHYSKRPIYHTVCSIKENLTLIFHIFNYVLKARERVSFKHDAYQCIRDIGYLDGVPDYLIGCRRGNVLDYKTVLKRLRYSLRIYDCYPLLSNKTIQLTSRDINDVESLAHKLVELGYEDRDDLCNVSKHKYPPIGMLVFPQSKYFRGGPSVTIMACMCSSRKRQPITPKCLLDNIDKIITNYDFVFYNLLLSKADK